MADGYGFSDAEFRMVVELVKDGEVVVVVSWNWSDVWVVID